MQNENVVELFQVEELEQRLENCWQGEKWQDQGYIDSSGADHPNWVKVPCDAPDYEKPNYSVPQEQD
jgi:hypothetical protein